MVFLNYVFDEIEYNELFITGLFMDLQSEMNCYFKFDRQNNNCEVWDSTISPSEITSIPIGFLLNRLEEKGHLDTRETHIAY